jgi:hypothetical protein
VQGVHNPYPSPSTVTPPSDNHYVGVDLEVTNATSHVEPFLPSFFSLTDRAGHRYGADPIPGAPGGLEEPLGGVDPGATIRGTLPFEVPDSASGLVLVFQPDPFTTVRLSLS